MATLTITDNYDGSASIAIAGAVGAWTLRVAAWHGLAGTDGWEDVATGTGNATETYTTADGGWFFFALEDTTGWTEPKYAVIRSVAECPHFRALEAITNVLKALDLPGMIPSRVFYRWVPKHLKEDGLPAIITSPYPQEDQDSKLNARDVIVYPVTVCLFDAADGELAKEIKRNLKWRHTIAKAVREQRVESGPIAVYRAQWAPMEVVNVQGLAEDYLVGGMVFKCKSWETRGI